MPAAKWHHVAGSENPADAASRGSLPTQLLEHSSWWKGPDWLTLPSTSWPHDFPLIPEATDLEEKPAVVLTVSQPAKMWELADKYSSIEKLLRITARLLDVVNRFRRVKCDYADSRSLPPSLRITALRFWIRKTQEAYFPGEMRSLKSGSSLPRSSPLLKLSPFVDEENLIRVGGRLQQSSFDEEAKHPYILPRDSTITRLLIDEAHRRTLHGGTQLTLSTLRQRVWIIGGRAPVKSFILRCISCTRQRGETTTEDGSTTQNSSQPSSSVPPLWCGLCRTVCCENVAWAQCEDVQSVHGAFRLSGNISGAPGACI